MLYESHALQDAIASCPVDCIHWVEKDQLPALEYVMRNKVPVTDVGTMMGGAGYRADVFAAAANFLKKREKEYVLVRQDIQKLIPFFVLFTCIVLC